MLDKLELRARRMKLNLTQKEFAHKLCIATEYYNRLERGKVPFPLYLLSIGK